MITRLLPVFLLTVPALLGQAVLPIRSAEAVNETPMAFEAAVKAPGARMATTTELGRIESGGAVAVFTALQLQSATPAVPVVSGIKIELS